MLPQQIAMAASFDVKGAEKFGFITGRDTRAAGIPWLFSPILGIATQVQPPSLAVAQYVPALS